MHAGRRGVGGEKGEVTNLLDPGCVEYWEGRNVGMLGCKPEVLWMLRCFVQSWVMFFCEGMKIWTSAVIFGKHYSQRGKHHGDQTWFFWWSSCDVLGEHSSNACRWTQLVLVAAVVLNLGSRVAQCCSVWWGWQEALYEETLIKQYQWGTVLLHFALNNGPSIVKLCFGIGKPSISNFWWMWWI